MKKKAVPSKVVKPFKSANRPADLHRTEPAAKKITKTPKTNARISAVSRSWRAQPAAAGVLQKPSSRPEPSRDDSAFRELPFSYNETKLVLLVRDPYTLYSYWDFSAETWNWITRMLADMPGTRAVLRIHNIDHGNFHDLDVSLEARNWYLHLNLPDTTFEAELGLIDPTGKFHLIARSNRVKTPRDTPSTHIDHDWQTEDAEEIYRLSGGGQTGHGSQLFSLFTKKR